MFKGGRQEGREDMTEREVIKVCSLFTRRLPRLHRQEEGGGPCLAGVGAALALPGQAVKQLRREVSRYTKHHTFNTALIFHSIKHILRPHFFQKQKSRFFFLRFVGTPLYRGYPEK